MTTQKAYTVRLAPEYAEKLAEQAKHLNESEPAFIRSLVMMTLDGHSPVSKDLGPMLEAIEHVAAKIDSLAVRVDALAAFVEPTAAVNTRVEKMAARLEALIKEFVHLSKWLQAQTKGLPT